MNHSTESSDPQIILSIVVPTCNRLSRLRRCIDKIRQAVTAAHEIIVVDGAGEDGTPEWLADQPNLVTIRETRREGAVRAFNRGFRGYAEIHRECNEPAIEAANQFLAQGTRIAAEIPNRYGR